MLLDFVVMGYVSFVSSRFTSVRMFLTPFFEVDASLEYFFRCLDVCLSLAHCDKKSEI